MSSPAVLNVNDVGSRDLEVFLNRFYSPGKAAFLRDHGAWWYRGDDNRWVIVQGTEIAGYCGVIPTRLHRSEESVDAAWWIDLVVAPEFRGRGLERVFDKEVKGAARVIVGFPNELAAKIHRRREWGVREDLRTVMMPLRPQKVRALQRLSGWRGRSLRMAAWMTSPLAALWRFRLRGWSPRCLVNTDPPSAEELAAIATHAAPSGYTTLRDSEYLRWRFFGAPYSDSLVYFRVVDESGAQIAAISRWKETDGQPVIRLLDLFGALDNRALLRQCIYAVGQEAVRQGAAQITALASNRMVQSALRSVGFVAGSVTCFCWWSGDKVWIDRLHRQDNYWVMADSDNDEP